MCHTLILSHFHMLVAHENWSSNVLKAIVSYERLVSLFPHSQKMGIGFRILFLVQDLSQYYLCETAIPLLWVSDVSSIKGWNSSRSLKTFSLRQVLVMLTICLLLLPYSSKVSHLLWPMERGSKWYVSLLGGNI